MFELKKTKDIERLIDISKSNSGVSGPALAKAHIALGAKLAEYIDVDPSDTTVVAMLRGGIFFAQGIYFTLGCRFDLYDPKQGELIMPSTKNVILVDSVVNTGKTIKSILKPGMLVACCVINEKAVEEFKDCLYTVRVSTNSFIGSDIKKQNGKRGPDTTMRLFNQL